MLLRFEFKIWIRTGGGGGQQDIYFQIRSVPSFLPVLIAKMFPRDPYVAPFRNLKQLPSPPSTPFQASLACRALRSTSIWRSEADHALQALRIRHEAQAYGGPEAQACMEERFKSGISQHAELSEGRGSEIYTDRSGWRLL